MLEFDDLEKRLKKTLYYGEFDTKQPSFPLTKIAVQLSRNATKKQLGHIDLDQAACIERNAAVSPCQMVLSLMYMKRVKENATAEYLQNVTSSDLFLLSMMVASKYLYDQGTDGEVFNDEWAEFGSIDVDEINSAESDFLNNIGWNLYVHASDFWEFFSHVEQRVALSEGLDRGAFSYTDLTCLFQQSFARVLSSHLLDAAKVIAVCTVAYMAGIATIATTIDVFHMTPSLLPNVIPTDGDHAVVETISAKSKDVVVSGIVDHSSCAGCLMLPSDSDLYVKKWHNISHAHCIHDNFGSMSANDLFASSDNYDSAPANYSMFFSKLETRGLISTCENMVIPFALTNLPAVYSKTATSMFVGNISISKRCLRSGSQVNAFAREEYARKKASPLGKGRFAATKCLNNKPRKCNLCASFKLSCHLPVHHRYDLLPTSGKFCYAGVSQLLVAVIRMLPGYSMRALICLIQSQSCQHYSNEKMEQKSLLFTSVYHS